MAICIRPGLSVLYATCHELSHLHRSSTNTAHALSRLAQRAKVIMYSKMPTDSASRQSVTKTVELPFYDDGPLRNLSTRSAASTTSIVSLAWSVVLKDFYQDQSTALLVDHGGGLWRRLSRVVTSNESVSQALESRDHNSSSTETVSPEDLEDHVSFAMSAFGLNGKTNGRQSKLQLRDVQQHASTVRTPYNSVLPRYTLKNELDHNAFTTLERSSH